MRTVQDFMLYAIKEGLSLVAHSLFVAIQEKIISPHDSELSIPYGILPTEKCLAATRANVLGIHPTYLFAIPYGQYFAMYLAKTEIDARNLHTRIFSTQASQVFDMTNKIETTLYDEETNKYASFSEIRDRTIQFPILVCCLEKRKGN